jgi:hypothetical protein
VYKIQGFGYPEVVLRTKKMADMVAYYKGTHMVDRKMGT